MQTVTSSSAELQILIGELKPHCGSIEVTLKGEEYDHVVSRLIAIRRLAVIEERELGAYRLADVARRNRPAIEQLAAEQFDGLVRDADSKIVRPDFGGKCR